MNALITGGCGFVGSNLAAHLLQQHPGIRVTLFDNLAREGSAANLRWLRTLAEAERGALTFVHGDIRNAFDVDALVGGLRPDAAFHLAGQVAMTTSLQSPRRDFEINVLGSLNLLESVRLRSPETAVIYASSNKIYGGLDHLSLEETETRYQPPPPYPGVDESAPLDFQTPYGCSKGAADQYMLDYARTFGVPTVVFRHSTIYGGRQHSTFDQGWIGWFCRQALAAQADPKREPFTVAGSGKQVRDLLHVTDAVRAYVAAFEHIAAARGHAFNIGGGHANSMSILELFRHLEGRLGIALNYTRLPERPSDQRYFVADTGKAGRMLGWSAQIDRKEGLESVLAWEASALRGQAGDP